MIPIILKRSLTQRGGSSGTPLTVKSTTYPNLTTSRPATSTIRVQQGAGTEDISDGTTPVWADFADGDGGGVMTFPSYTTPDIASLGRVPAILSGSSNGPGTQTNTAPGAVVSAGDIGIEMEWIVCWIDQETRFFDSYYAWAGTGSEGEASLRYDWTVNSWFLKVRGVDVLQAGVIGGGDGRVMTWRQGDRFRARAWYRPSTGQCGIRLCVNGSWGRLTTGSTTGGALASLTSFKWGSDLSSAGNLLAQHTIHSTDPVAASATPSISWIDIGDSTCASYGQMVNVSSTYLTPTQRLNTALYGTSLAVPGQTAVSQLATYNASEFTTATGVQWAWIRVGLNDIGGYTVTQYMVNLRAIIAKLKSDHAGIKVGVGTLTPAYSYWVAQFGSSAANLYYADWLAINANISGTGSDPLTQADFFANAHSTTMLAGDGKSMISTLTPDGIHPLNNGRVGYISPSQLAAIHAAGFLT